MPRGAKPGQRFGGRKKGTQNKVTREIKAICQQHGQDMVDELARIAKQSESEPARVAAIKEILDRGYGKSVQVMDHNISFFDMLGPDELASLRSALADAIATEADGVGEDREGDLDTAGDGGL